MQQQVGAMPEQAQPIPISQEPMSSASAAVLRLYDTHQREVFTFLLATTHDTTVAEDLIQDAFLRLLREAQEGRLPLNPRAWLYRVASNLAMSRARRMRTASRWELRQPPPGTEASPEDEYVRREDEKRLVNGLAALDEPARMGLILAAHGFRGAEIASALGRSESATRTLMCRARLRLRDLLSTEEAVRD